MRLQTFVLLAPLLFVTSCDEHKEDKKPAKSPKAPLNEKQDPSAEVEAFTGAHTRLVWSEYSQAGESDTFATSEGLTLKGLDTRDGLGERTIQAKPGNYSRPLLTCDGTGILWTDKNAVRKNGRKHYKPIIYLTGWKGGRPIRLAEGYAVDCWRDPSNGVEFVYAVQDLKATKGLALEGNRLVRFPLMEPEKVEIVYDDTPVTPDNVQFSRDGTRASGLFPWPHAGLLSLENGKWTAAKLSIGCWTSLAPDNSGVSWIFDGEHKSVAMFADDGEKSWHVKFNTVPGADGLELYHPRWSNHPRFIVLTGPYKRQKNEAGSVINKGGGSAQVFIGKLSGSADKVEAWLQISHDKHAESYPDAWIEGADSADLKDFSIPRGPKTGGAALAGKWPARRDGLMFIWQDRTTLNAFTSRDGGKHEAFIESRGAARYGRFHEMLLDGGMFEAESESAALALQHLREKPEAAFEALLLPAQFEGGEEPQAPCLIFAGPGFHVGIEKGRLTLAQPSGGMWGSVEALPAKPFHLAVNRNAQGFDAFVDGEPFALSARSAAPDVPPAGSLTFGGGWSGGLMHVALYDRVLTEEDIAASSEVAQARIATFTAPPPRVRLQARLVEASALPTPEGIAPYTSALVSYVYDVEQVVEGDLNAKRVLVKHWCMLDQKVAQGFPREVGKSYGLTLERESDHAHLKGERVMDDTTAFDLEVWFDVSPPRVVEDTAN